MAASNIVGLAIITTPAAALNKAGVTAIEASVDVAKAIDPLDGHLAKIVVAAGIIGTGLLTVPFSRDLPLTLLARRRAETCGYRASQGRQKPSV